MGRRKLVCFLLTVSLLAPFPVVQGETTVSFWVPGVLAAGKGCDPRKEGQFWLQAQSRLPPGVKGYLPTNPRLGLLWFTLPLFRGPKLQGQKWCPSNGLGMESHPTSGTSRRAFPSQAQWAATKQTLPYSARRILAGLFSSP